MISDRQLRGYELRARLGAARGVTLHTARQNVSGQDVGIQLLDPELVGLTGFVNRLAAVAAQVTPLRHPRVVATDRVVTGDQVAAVVTEPVIAVPLSSLLMDRQALPLAAAMVVVDDVLRGVGAAHAAGLVHCGICPERVVVQADGEVRLDGFAIARAMALTGGDVGAPIPGYSSPERLGGVLPDGVGDLYAAAALAHRLLCGATPTPGTAAPVVELPALTGILTHALAADPRRRYPSAAALRNALTGTVAELLGPDWRSRSALGGQARARLEEVGAIAPPRAPVPPPTAPVAFAAAAVAPVPAAPGPVAPPRPAPARGLPPPVAARPRRWPIAALIVVLLLVVGGGALAAVLLTRSSGSPTPVTTAGPLAVGKDLALTVDRQDGSAGACDTVYVATARGTLMGQGTLTYHWEQNNAPVPGGDTSIPITVQPGLAIVEKYKYSGHRSGTATFAFVVTAPQQRSVSKTVDVTC